MSGRAAAALYVVEAEDRSSTAVEAALPEYHGGDGKPLPEAELTIDVGAPEWHIDFYIDKAREADGALLTSERALARRLGLNPSTISNWRQRKIWPSDEVMVRLARLGGQDADVALLCLNYWRTKSPQVRRLYERMLVALGCVKIHWVVAGLALVLSASPA